MSNQVESKDQSGIPQTEVVPPTIPQSEVARLLDERDVGDGGRVLVLLMAAGADGEERGISEERLQSYLYVLSQEGIVPVGYSFHASPLPFSDELAESLQYIRGSGYISVPRKGKRDQDGFFSVSYEDDKLWLTEEGKKWVDKKLQEDKSKMISPIQELIQELSGKNRGELFEACFPACFPHRKLRK